MNDIGKQYPGDSTTHYAFLVVVTTKYRPVCLIYIVYLDSARYFIIGS